MLFRGSTGVPVVDAQEHFRRARRGHVAARPVHRAHVPRTLPGTAGVPRGQARLEVIPLTAVVGAVEPTIRFDAHFLAGPLDRSALPRRTLRGNKEGLGRRPCSSTRSWLNVEATR
jgi:hypothetical protein